jgi:hypothetical protein
MAIGMEAPAATIAKIAVRSAQTVKPKLAFSTLAPTNTEPSAKSNAAPTGYFE